MVQYRLRLTHIKRKRRGICTRYSSHISKAFALPTVAWTSNAEIAHADMYNDKVHLMLKQGVLRIYNIPRRHPPLLLFRLLLEICEISNSQRQKRSKRLFLNICLFPPTLRLSTGLSVEETLQNYKINSRTENINGKNILIYRFFVKNHLQIARKFRHADNLKITMNFLTEVPLPQVVIQPSPAISPLRIWEKPNLRNIPLGGCFKKQSHYQKVMSFRA